MKKIIISLISATLVPSTNADGNIFGNLFGDQIKEAQKKIDEMMHDNKGIIEKGEKMMEDAAHKEKHII